jgi:hypothetical protein
VSVGKILGQQPHPTNGVKHAAPANVVTKLHPTSKKEFDRACAKWNVKSCRPHSMPEDDKAFRDFIRTITHGQYSPLAASTVNKIAMDMSIECQKQLKVRSVLVLCKNIQIVMPFNF